MFREIAIKEVHSLLHVPKRNADVGIELEIEGYALPGVVPNWSSKPEGSLQQGMEYITKPIKLEYVEPYTNNLQGFFNSESVTISPSYRCSTHIHVNVTAETLADVLGFYTIFTMFEQVLLRLCGNERNGNLFCMSSADTGDIVYTFNQFCSVLHNIETHGFGFSRGKYASFNIDRLRDLGTLEARCFPLCVKKVGEHWKLDGTKLRRWCEWLLSMKAMAKAEPDKTFRALWKNVRQNPDWYCAKIFGDDFWGMSPEETKDLMETGTEIGYELTRTLKKWYATEKEQAPATRKKKKTAEEIYNTMLTSYAGTAIDGIITDTEF